MKYYSFAKNYNIAFMKKITILFTTLLMLLISFTAIAMNDITIALTLSEIEQNDPIFSDDTPIGNRSGQSKVLCTMTPNNISISGMDINDVYSFDVLDSDGLLIAKFSNESDFLDFIFSTRGYFEIRFVLENTTLCGHITLY